MAKETSRRQSLEINGDIDFLFEKKEKNAPLTSKRAKPTGKFDYLTKN